MKDGTTGRKKIVVVIATYNEAGNIAALLNALSYPVIVVDDSSPDGTGNIARACGATVITRPPKSGIASAYYDGFKEALAGGYDYIVQMDAGLTHNPKDVALLARAAIDNECGLVIGSRFFGDVPFGYRSVLSRMAARMMRYHNIWVLDATSGFRCWDAGLLRQVIARPFRAKHFAFQLETFYRARKCNLMEVPIQYNLTNSSFRWPMVWEALKIFFQLSEDNIG